MMKKDVQYILLITFAIICGLVSCQYTPDVAMNQDGVNQHVKFIEYDGDIETDIIDTDIQEYISDCSERVNPYAMHNMREALYLIREELENPCGLPNTINISNIASSINLDPTNYYIVIYPELASDYTALVDDMMIVAEPHPLLVETIDGYYGSEMTYLSDIQEEAPALYCSCGSDLLSALDENGIYFSIIDTLFIPEHSSELPMYRMWFNSPELPDLCYMDQTTREERDFAEAITYMAFRQAGYETENIGPIEETECETKYFLWWSWTDCDTYHHPTGQINIETPNGLTGVSGVQVRLFRWFISHYVYTDGCGYYYDSRRWKKLWLTDEISYSIYTEGNRNYGLNRWNLRTSIGGAIPLWTYSYNCGFHSSVGYSVDIYPSSEKLWGRCVLNNAIYDYCVYAENENLTMPPSHLNIATGQVHDGDWTSSCPLLQNHINVSLLNIPFIGSLLELVYLLMAPYPIIPDMLLKYKADITKYEKITGIVWHELTHSSHYNRTQISNGFSAASIYWSKIVTYEADHAINDGSPYGIVGANNWEQIALSEGWAYYREWYMGNRYLGYNNNRNAYWGNSSRVSDYYATYYSSLYNHGITMNEMELALANTYTLAQFKEKLLSICPQKSNIINTYLP